MAVASSWKTPRRARAGNESDGNHHGGTKTVTKIPKITKITKENSSWPSFVDFVNFEIFVI